MAKKAPETNPFVQTLEIKAIWKLMFTNNGTPNTDGQVAMREKAEKILMDVDDRASIFTAHILVWFKELPSNAKDMFMWIAAHLHWETDVIQITEDTYCEEMKVSRATFFAAKSALVNRLIIPRASRKNTYWVNPTYLYKGSRLKQFPDQVVIQNTDPFERLKRE